MKLKQLILKSKLKAPINFLQHRCLSKNDIFIISYPKSGSTWFRFVLYELLTNNHSSFERVNNTIPTIGKHFNSSIKTPYGRFIKSHEPYRKKYKKSIVIVRDVRDVIISEFYHNKRKGIIPDKEKFEVFLENFLSDAVNRFGNYHENVSSWIRASKFEENEILFLKFEDLKLDPLGQFNKVNEFLNLGRSKNFIVEKISNNTIDRMKQKEDKSTDRTLISSNKNIRFIGNGSTGNWKDIYSKDQLNKINKRFREILLFFEYDKT